MRANRPIRLLQWAELLFRIRRAYRRHHGRSPRLFRPRRYTEKMQWRKSFDLQPHYAIFNDKLATREFVKARLGSDCLVPLLWYGDNPDLIPFDDLTPPYVVKSTHASGHTIIVGKGQVADRQRIRETARAWFAHCHGSMMAEPGYIHVPRRLLIERQLLAENDHPPLERKFFVFDSNVAAINTVLVDAARERFSAFHTADWKVLPWVVSTRPSLGEIQKRPALLEGMLHAASSLADGFDHLRIDMYDQGDRFWVGEVTVYPYSGLEPFDPDDADYRLGAAWKIQKPLRRGLAAIAGRRWEIVPPRQTQLENVARYDPGAGPLDSVAKHQKQSIGSELAHRCYIRSS